MIHPDPTTASEVLAISPVHYPGAKARRTTANVDEGLPGTATPLTWSMYFRLPSPRCGAAGWTSACCPDRNGRCPMTSTAGSFRCGLPCVAGTRTATTTLRDRMRVRVNGSTGVVQILSGTPSARDTLADNG